MRSVGNRFYVEALDKRGELLIPILLNAIAELESIESKLVSGRIEGIIHRTERTFTEEERTSQPSIFHVLRSLKNLFHASEDSFLGLYGAFGYDLVFQLESMPLRQERDSELSEMVLFIPDELIVVDHQMSCAYRISYEFEKTVNPRSRSREQRQSFLRLPRSGEKWISNIRPDIMRD